MQLHIRDPAFTDRLVAFLRSVGQDPVVRDPATIDVDLTPEEVEVYLRVWSVMHPGATVEPA
ncbi:MAG TPA: hypothetical protein VFA30_06980 [Gaiellaceae bacterium]|nr:hypothetical protein [Gaiellaceae bacterium]